MGLKSVDYWMIDNYYDYNLLLSLHVSCNSLLGYHSCDYERWRDTDVLELDLGIVDLDANMLHKSNNSDCILEQ